MLESLRAVAGSLGKMRILIFGQLLYAALTGAPIFFLFMAIMELDSPSPSKGRLIAICSAQLAVTLVNVFVAVKVHVSTYLESFAITTEARLRLGNHLRLLSMGFFKERDPGDISALLLQDMTKVEVLFSHLLTEAVSMLGLTVLMAILFLSQDLRLGSLMLATIAVAAPALYGAQKMVARFGKRQIGARNRASSMILEYLQGMSVLKSFNLAGKSFERLKRVFETLKKESILLEAATGVPITIFAMVLDLGLAALLVYATWLMSANLVPAMVFVLFVVIGAKFFEPLLNFGLFFSELRFMALAADRLAKAMKEKPLPISLPSGEPSGYDVEFRSVSFGYDPRRLVIKGLSLKIPQRSVTALVGPSGSGKTTLASLLARFWDCGEGRILIGGADVRSIGPEKLNALFSFVFQDVYLFQGTILENIRVGDKSASPDMIARAAELAQCRPFIEALPEGYETKVGEGGTALSGGERQRISIARAILKNAPIVVLDEATASLDPENELNIQKAIGELIREKTVIVIAHRLRTVVSADQLAVIEDGRLKELGTHQSLLAAGGLYASLWAEQLKTGGWRLPKREALEDGSEASPKTPRETAP